MALCWLAVVKAGMVAVATMPLLRARELGDIIDKAQPALALCDATLLAELKYAQQEHPALRTIQKFNAADDPADLGALCAGKSGVFAPCPTAADDIALMAFTSGTTGKPKAAMHTHRDVLAACETWPRHVLCATPDDIVMGSPPLAFTFGLGGMLIFPMWAGASVYYPDIAYTPEAMVRLIGEVGATICYTAPTFYRQMAPFAKAVGIPSLRCASAPAKACQTPPASSGARPPASRCSTASAPPRCSTSSSRPPGPRCGAAPSARWCRATPRRWWTTWASRCRAARSASWR
jgi:2-aminobenzoate-CoA ligase